MFRRASRLGCMATASVLSGASFSSRTESSQENLLTQPSFGATVNLKREASFKHSDKIDVDSILIIQGSAHKKLAADVSELLDIPIGDVSISRFADGEVNVMINDSIRGKNVFIVQTCAAPVNDAVMELLLTVSCAKRSGARRINAIIPYFGYKHHRRGSPISTKHGSRFLASGAMDFAKMLTEMGVDRVVAVDLQRPGQGSEACFFDNSVPLESIGTTKLQMRTLMDNVTFENPIVVVAPNAECVKKARQCQDMLQKSLNREVKMSTYFQTDTSSGPTDTARLALLDSPAKFAGADVIIVDDMIDSAGTVSALSKRIDEAGAANIYAIASHGLFTQDSMQAIDGSPLKRVFVTDSLPLPAISSLKITQIPIAPLLARVILAEHFRTTSEATDSFEEDDFTNEN